MTMQTDLGRQAATKIAGRYLGLGDEARHLDNLDLAALYYLTAWEFFTEAGVKVMACAAWDLWAGICRDAANRETIAWARGLTGGRS